MIKTAAVASYIDKANRALGAARLLLAQSDTEGACSRAYYAMFHAAHAALWAVGAHERGAVIKTHSGLISSFGQEIVKPAIMDADYGRLLGKVNKTRMLADYTVEPPSEEDARKAVEQAGVFVAGIQAKFIVGGS